MMGLSAVTKIRARADAFYNLGNISGSNDDDDDTTCNVISLVTKSFEHFNKPF
jgi:hypothetical protein